MPNCCANCGGWMRLVPDGVRECEDCGNWYEDEDPDDA